MSKEENTPTSTGKKPPFPIPLYGKVEAKAGPRRVDNQLRGRIHSAIGEYNKKVERREASLIMVLRKVDRLILDGQVAEASKLINDSLTSYASTMKPLHGAGPKPRRRVGSNAGHL